MDDADWDALTDRLLDLVPDLVDAELFRLLAALAEASHVDDERARAEAHALSASVVDRVREAWDTADRPIPVSLLGSWFETAAALPRSPAAPELAFTWIELLPTESVDLTSATDVVALEEWVTLVALLAEHQPDALAAFGFPQKQLAALSAVVDRAGAIVERGDPPELVGRLVRALRRLASLPRLPNELARRAREAAAGALLPPEAPPERIGPARPRDEPPPDRTIVARVLADLSPAQ